VAVYSIDKIYSASRIELKENRRNGLDVFYFPQTIGNLDGHRRTAERKNHLGRRRLNHDISADTFYAFRGFRQDPAREPNHQYDESDFDGNREYSDERAKRPVHQIAENQLAHHGLDSLTGCVPFSSPTWTSSEFCGCTSWKRSAGKSSFKVSFVICKSIR